MAGDKDDISTAGEAEVPKKAMEKIIENNAQAQEISKQKPPEESKDKSEINNFPKATPGGNDDRKVPSTITFKAIRGNGDKKKGLARSVYIIYQGHEEERQAQQTIMFTQAEFTDADPETLRANRELRGTNSNDPGQAAYSINSTAYAFYPAALIETANDALEASVTSVGSPTPLSLPSHMSACDSVDAEDTGVGMVPRLVRDGWEDDSIADTAKLYLLNKKEEGMWASLESYMEKRGEMKKTGVQDKVAMEWNKTKERRAKSFLGVPELAADAVDDFDLMSIDDKEEYRQGRETRFATPDTIDIISPKGNEADLSPGSSLSKRSAASRASTLGRGSNNRRLIDEQHDGGFSFTEALGERQPSEELFIGDLPDDQGPRQSQESQQYNDSQQNQDSQQS